MYLKLAFGTPPHHSALGAREAAGRRLGTEIGLGQRSEGSQAGVGEGHPRCKGGESGESCVAGVREGLSSKPIPPATDLWFFPFQGMGAKWRQVSCMALKLSYREEKQQTQSATHQGRWVFFSIM